MNENNENQAANIANSVNENNLLEQTTRNNKKIMAYAMFGLGILLLIVILFWSLKSLGSSDEDVDDTKIEQKESNSLTDSVKKNRDFTLKNETPKINLLDLANDGGGDTNNTPQSLPNKDNNPFVAPTANNALQQQYVTPRIVKGMGRAVVVNNKDIQSSSSSRNPSANNNLNLVGKPDTVLEFGQNGAMSLNGLQNIVQESLGGGSNGGGGSSNTGEVFQPTAAKFSNFNASLLLPKGTYIGCALQTRLVSEVKGGISCVVNNDVYSANGHTLLIEKGSVMTGTYSSGELNDGSTRLFVIWQEIRTPNNIVIPVFSGATDPLGAAGLEGYVNHHYMKRFGAAILLSVIDDSLAIIANELSSKNNTNYRDYTENTREQASEIANTALKEMINIKPTLYKNQGDLVGVYVNKDIDFSKVYQLKRKQK